MFFIPNFIKSGLKLDIFNPTGCHKSALIFGTSSVQTIDLLIPYIYNLS